MVDPWSFRFKSGLFRSCLNEENPSLQALFRDEVGLQAKKKALTLSTHLLNRQRKNLEVNQAANTRLSRILRRKEGKVPERTGMSSSETELIKSTHRHSEEDYKIAMRKLRSKLKFTDHGFRYQCNGDERCCISEDDNNNKSSSRVGKNGRCFVNSSAQDLKTLCLMSVMIHSRDDTGSYHFNPFPGDLISDREKKVNNKSVAGPSREDNFEDSFVDYETKRSQNSLKHSSLSKIRRPSYNGNTTYLVKQNRNFIRESLRNLDLLEKAIDTSERLRRRPAYEVPFSFESSMSRHSSTNSNRKLGLEHQDRQRSSRASSDLSRASYPSARETIPQFITKFEYKNVLKKELASTECKVEDFISEVKEEVRRCHKLRTGGKDRVFIGSWSGDT